jgi:nucleotide-binding universal stress UspA family protein
MYTRLLIPLDGSKLAEQILPYARFLARSLKIPVELLEVIDPDVIETLSGSKQGRSADIVLAEKKQASLSYLGATARSFLSPEVKCVAESGKPEDVVIERAAADRGTLIAMTTHGRSGLQRWLLGSVTEKVLRGSTNHLFVVRASDQPQTPSEAEFKRVLVPLDGSEIAEKVLPYAVDLAGKMRLEVILIRTYMLPPSVAAEDYGSYLGEFTEALEAEAREYVGAKVKELKAKGLENVSSVVEFGFPAEKIIELAQKIPDNFVAMCTHGRSGIKAWALGSVTERVVRHSGDPVLVIRASSS